MKISVLIPTRDRLSLLQHAVGSVLRLDDHDCEIVVSDNDSSEDVKGWIESLNEPRIVYVRTAEALPVTDNWNNALAHSSGEYVVMLGDDDALLGTYFSRIRSLIADFGRPQVIYHNALVYAYPGVVPGEPGGFLRSEGYADFLRSAREPFRLDREQASSMVRAAMGFRVRFGFNMQFATVARTIIDQLSESGPFYRSPFPDYYAMNHLFIRAATIVADPQPAVVIGVSPRSYGFFHNNRQESAGHSFLQGTAGRAEPDRRAGELLPGTNINDGWLQAMSRLHEELGSPDALRPDYRRYRRLQIAYVHEGRFLRESISDAELAQLARLMSPAERLLYGALFRLLSSLGRLAPALVRERIPAALQLAQRQFPAWDPVRDEHSYGDISEVVARIDPGAAAPEWQQPRLNGPVRMLIRRLAALRGGRAS